MKSSSWNETKKNEQELQVALQNCPYTSECVENRPREHAI